MGIMLLLLDFGIKEESNFPFGNDCTFHANVFPFFSNACNAMLWSKRIVATFLYYSPPKTIRVFSFTPVFRISYLRVCSTFCRVVGGEGGTLVYCSIQLFVVLCFAHALLVCVITFFARCY